MQCVDILYKTWMRAALICKMSLALGDSFGIILDNLNCSHVTQVRSVCKWMQKSTDDKYLQDGKLVPSFLAARRAKAQGISTPVIEAMLAAATTEVETEAVYRRLMEMLDDMYMVDTVVVSILTALYRGLLDRYVFARYLKKITAGPIHCDESCFVRTCFMAMRYHVNNTVVQDIIQNLICDILQINTVTLCDFICECLCQTVAANLTRHDTLVSTLEILKEVCFQDTKDFPPISQTLRTRAVTLMFVLIQDFSYIGPQPETQYSTTCMNSARVILCKFLAYADYSPQIMATAYGYLYSSLSQKNPPVSLQYEFALPRYRYIPCLIHMVEKMACGHTAGDSPMIIAFLQSGILGNMNQDCPYDDELSGNIAMEATLYTRLLEYGYKELLDMADITHRVTTFLQVRACIDADMEVENDLLTMLTRCVTLVDIDPVTRVDSHWQQTLSKHGLISLCIGKAWKYMSDYEAETRTDDIRKTVAGVQENNISMWLHLLEVLLYKNRKTQRNFIKQRGMQVLFRVAMSSYASVERQIMLLLSTLSRGNTEDVWSQCPDVLNQEVVPENDRLDTASGHTERDSPMVMSFLQSSVLGNINQNCLYADELSHNIVMEATLYTRLLEYPNREMLDMAVITHRVTTFLKVNACIDADMEVENDLLTMLTRRVTLVNIDPVTRVDSHWQQTLCKHGLISLCIGKAWKYMSDYVANTHQYNIWKTVAGVQENNISKWLDLLEVLLYKNRKTQRNFIKNHGMQVLFRVAVSSYASVQRQIMVLLCTMLRDNRNDVLSQCPDFLNREVVPEIDGLDVVTFTSKVQKLSEVQESM